MAREEITIGTTDARGGDPPHVSWAKVNRMTDDLYGRIVTAEDAEASATSAAASASSALASATSAAASASSASTSASEAQAWAEAAAGASGTALQEIPTGGEYSYRVGSRISTMDATVYGAWIFTGTSSFPNKLGATGKPVTEPPLGTRATDSSYVAGDADLAAIVYGYDNYCNALAASIGSMHARIFSGATHAAIFGGSLHTIDSGSDYASIWGGSGHWIEQDCDYAVMVGGLQNWAKAGASTAASGHRAAFLGGLSNIVQGQYGSCVSGNSNTISATYGTTINGQSCTVSGSHAVAAGNTVTVSGAYSDGHGNAVTVSGTRSRGFGDTLTAAYDYADAFGNGVVAPFAGSRSFSARQRGGTAGNNQSVDWTASNETTDTTTTRLSLYGSSTYPTQPASSIVNGTVWVTAVKDDGTCSSFKIDFTSERIGTGTPTLRANSTTTVYNGLALGTVPTMNVTTGGIYRVQVVGLSATNIRWIARSTETHVVYA